MKRDPALRIVLVDAEIAGFGASGRNGGWISPAFPVSPSLLVQRYGVDSARSLLQAVSNTVDEISSILDREGLDADFRKCGVLRIARGTAQVPALRESYAAYQRLGLDSRYQSLPPGEVERRIRAARVMGGLFTPDCASVHPGKLVRGLARVIERLGATIYEKSPVTSFAGKPAPRLVSRSGEVRARTVVLAGEAYMTGLRALHRTLLPAYSSIILTAPLGQQTWSQIGWSARECVASYRLTVDYLTRTADGRILLGSRGAPYHFGSRVSPEYDRDPRVITMLRRLLVDWFPVLEGTRITHAWAGPVGTARDWMPTASFDSVTGIATARGYTGQGVATSNLAGRILADLITGVNSEVVRLPIANHRSRSWEPEPLRWLAVRYTQNRLQHLDEVSEKTGRPPSGKNLAERLSRH